MSLGETLREVRRKKGWSIEQLSKCSGVPARLIREIESQSPSSYVPSEANTVLLGEALRIPVGILLGQRDRVVERWRPPGRSTAGIEEQSA
jgi:transcriptional regulator with XRE-family HTH domain